MSSGEIGPVRILSRVSAPRNYQCNKKSRSTESCLKGIEADGTYIREGGMTKYERWLLPAASVPQSDLPSHVHDAILGGFDQGNRPMYVM